MLVLKIAFKNLFRYKRRTFITGLAIAVGLAFYIFIDSLLTGWYSGAEHGYINYEVASGRIVKQAWWDEKERMPLSESIENTEALTSLMQELDVAYAPRTEFAADLVFYEDPYPQDGVYPTKVTAIDPQLDAEVFDLASAIEREHSRGEFLSEGQDGVVVGYSLAEKLGMKVGYPIRLQFTGKMGYEEILDTRIIGIVETESNMVDMFGVFISMDTAEYYLQMDGAVTGYSVKVPQGRKGRAVLSELEQKLPDEYRLLGYEEIAADFVAMQQMENSFVYFGIFIVFLIAAVGVSNTMMMAIFERRREIGMMRAQGLKDREIQLMFFFEAGGIGLLGTAAGLLLGALVNWPLVEIGFDYGALLQTYGGVLEFGGFVIDAVLKGVWSFKSFASGALIAILISSFVSFFPTHRMLKKSIPDNLRME